MSSKRAIRRRACDGKVRHETSWEARKAIRDLNRKRGYQGPMNAYKCKFCGGFHVGHSTRYTLAHLRIVTA